MRVLRAPPEAGFDCGRKEQNRFFYESAWADQQAHVSVTYLYFVGGTCAAYATLCMDALPLGRRERAEELRYPEIGALKLAQLGVDRRFQRKGVGRLVVADMTTLARVLARSVGCRYVSLDAQPELVGWYESQGFTRNELRQAQRVVDALKYGREPEKIAVSMRFDLRDSALE